MKIIINDLVTLRQFSLDQVELFYRSIHFVNDPLDEYRLRLQKKHLTISDTENVLIDAIENKFQLDGTPDYFIYYNDEIAGVFEFAPLEAETDFVEVGYWLYRDYRRKGILSSIFPTMISFAKNSFDRNRLIAT